MKIYKLNFNVIFTDDKKIYFASGVDGMEFKISRPAGTYYSISGLLSGNEPFDVGTKFYSLTGAKKVAEIIYSDEIMEMDS